jgi:hypothetical protein
MFSTKGVLNTHQKSAKYCLVLQNASTKGVVYNCEHCSNNYTQKIALDRHLLKCVNKMTKEKDNIIEKQKVELFQKDQQIKELQDKIENIALQAVKKPTSVHNNTTTNTNNTVMMMKPFDMNDKEVISKAVSDSFNQNHLLCGQKGVAKFAAEYLLKDENGDPKYICTDPSRQVYKFKTPSGEIEKDLKANKLTIALMDANMIGKSHSITMEKVRERPTDMNVFWLYTENFNEIKKMLDDNTEFRGELANLTCK